MKQAHTVIPDILLHIHGEEKRCRIRIHKGGIDYYKRDGKVVTKSFTWHQFIGLMEKEVNK